MGRGKRPQRGAGIVQGYSPPELSLRPEHEAQWAGKGTVRVWNRDRASWEYLDLRTCSSRRVCAARMGNNCPCDRLKLDASKAIRESREEW